MSTQTPTPITTQSVSDLRAIGMAGNEIAKTLHGSQQTVRAILRTLPPIGTRTPWSKLRGHGERGFGDRDIAEMERKREKGLTAMEVGRRFDVARRYGIKVGE
jgi:hypothetical protein